MIPIKAINQFVRIKAENMKFCENKVWLAASLGVKVIQSSKQGRFTIRKQDIYVGNNALKAFISYFPSFVIIIQN